MVDKSRLEAIIVEQSDRGVVVFNEGKAVYNNPAAERLLGYKPGELLGTDFANIYARELELDNKMRGQVLRADGSALDAEIYTKKDGEGNLYLYLSDAETTAIYDPMTGLLNRVVLEELLKEDEHLTKRYGKEFQQRYGTDIGFLMIDINGFKGFNDRHGHQKGDEILKGIAKILRESVQRESDLVVRYGGDEFIIIMPSTNAEGSKKVYDRIMQKVSDWNSRENGSFGELSLAIGSYCWDIEEYSQKGIRIRDGIDRADQDMYRMKREMHEKLGTPMR